MQYHHTTLQLQVEQLGVRMDECRAKVKSKSIQTYLLAANKRRCTASECEIVRTALIIITLCTHEFIRKTVHDTTTSEL
jgi:hypothetical protein